ncbi:MAG: NAD(P)H-dependent oxidoreductase [Nocardioides sp.]|nr:NAD(P)H-dependent oxidoreductase [Nocardioides sp.]
MSRAPLRVVVVSAGLRDPSATRLLADRIADAVVRRTGAGGAPVAVTHVELRLHARALADHLLTGFPAPELAAAIAEVATADAVVAVTPVFSASYSGLFKTFFDVLEPGTLDGVPVLVAATAGSARHSLVLDHALRPLFSHLRAVVVPTGVFAAAEDWGSVDDTTTALEQRIDRAVDELAALLRPVAPVLHVVGAAPAGASAPSAAEGEDPEFPDLVPFEELLGR